MVTSNPATARRLYCRLCDKWKDASEFYKPKPRMQKSGLYVPPEPDVCIVCIKRRERLRKYWVIENGGMRAFTLTDLRRLLEAQEYRCANELCRKVLSMDDNATHIDHDHATGRVRGILCAGCNVALGAAQDDSWVLEGLIKYLEMTRKK